MRGVWMCYGVPDELCNLLLLRLCLLGLQQGLLVSCSECYAIVRELSGVGDTVRVGYLLWRASLDRWGVLLLQLVLNGMPVWLGFKNGDN